MPPRPSKLVPVLAAIVAAVLTLILLRKIYRALIGKERLPIYWILGRLLGDHYGAELGNRMDQQQPEPDGSGPNWGAFIFYVMLLIGWVLLLYAWMRVALS
jgi:hypothetical protein